MAEGVGLAACLLTIVVLALFELVTRNLRLRGIVALPPSPPWIDGVMRHSVFLLGFLGAAYATFTRRHIRIDAVTRLLRPRARLAARAVVTLAAVALCGALIAAGLDFHRVCVEEDAEAASQEQLFTSARGALVIITGFALVGLHSLVHALADLALVLRGSPPGVADEPHA